MKHVKGFTLIEVIVTLMLVSFMAVIAGLGIAKAVEGYLFAKENTAVSQQAQLALGRLNRELSTLISVTTASANSLIFENVYGNRAIGLAAGAVKIGTNTVAAGDILADNVNSFSLGFYQEDGATVWSTADDVRDLYVITIALAVDRNDNRVEQFSTIVNPRNTGVKAGPYYKN